MKYKVSFEVEIDELDERSIAIGRETLVGLLIHYVWGKLERGEAGIIECIDD